MSKCIAQDWLKASNDDLILIGEIIHNDYLTHLIAFHAQQSIEKALKALLEYEGQNTPKKHDLLLLKNQVSDFITIQNEVLLEELNTLYTESRYPGDFGLLPNGKPTLQEAKEFYEFAKNIYLEVERLLNAK